MQRLNGHIIFLALLASISEAKLTGTGPDMSGTERRGLMSPPLHWLAAIVALISGFLITAAAPAQDLTKWNSEGAVVIGGDSFPLILPSGQVRLFYAAPSPPADGTGSAISSDGRNFVDEPGTRLHGTPRILQLGPSLWRMFYRSGAVDAGGIFSATSPDGLNYTAEPGVRIQASPTLQVGFFTIVPMQGGSYYRIYFDNGFPSGNPRYIMSATSTDMQNWTVEQGVRVGPGSALSANANNPFAIANGDGSVTLFYNDGVGTAVKFATSPDGLTFSGETVTDIGKTANSPCPQCICSQCTSPAFYPMANGHLRAYYDTGVNGATYLYSATSIQPAPGITALVAAVLPSSRSVAVGATATAFATIINAGLGKGASCHIAPVTNVPATFTFQTTNSATNALSGTVNTPAQIAPNNGVQSFVIAITPTAAFAPTDVQLSLVCNNGAPAPIVSGLDTLLLSASTTATPDVIALGATPSADGILDITGTTGAAAFAVATANVGASGAITAAADTGAGTLPVTLTICQTNPSTGACLASPASSAPTTTIDANATPTFSIFAKASGSIGFDPANSRIFVRFKDAGGAVRGSTSVAVRTQ
jgi:hypothetical protein